MKFPLISSNILASPTLEYISLSWYDIPELVYQDSWLLTRKTQNQVFLVIKLKSSVFAVFQSLSWLAVTECLRQMIT